MIDELKATLMLYRESMRRQAKLTIYDHSQAAGVDMGWDRMVDWASEADHAFVEHLTTLCAERDAAVSMVERLIEASKVVIANAYENDGWVLLNSIVKIQTLIDEWRNRKETK